LGELYLQWEDLSKYLGAEGLLNARIGQFYIPFGEEYERRFAFENPLISHSLSDLWGLNPGVELYGGSGPINYAVAIQNGGIANLTDGTADKSLAGRVGYDPRPWLGLSVSGMRTGQLSVKNDSLSAIWFGNTFFQSIGSPNTTDFQVNLAEFDADASWKTGNVRTAAGYANYSDNDPLGKNTRDIYYYYVEALQHLTSKLYAVTRWSQIRSPKGYVLAGEAANYSTLATDLWRLSLGLGYQFNSHLEIKAEYLFENGSLVTGGNRDHENMVATEAAFKF
jgi:hypothetical protein